jgi:hypothetical protein
MFRLIISITLSALSLFSVLIAGSRTVTSETGQGSRGSTFVRAYRSAYKTHKAIVYGNNPDTKTKLLGMGASVIEEYGAFTLLRVPDSVVDAALPSPEIEQSLRDDLNMVSLRNLPFDTTQIADGGKYMPAGSPQGTASGSPNAAGPTHTGQQLLIVQMVGPIKPEWVKWLKSKAEVISYVPNDAYLVRASQDFAADLATGSVNKPGYVQWSGQYRAESKIAPEILLNSTEPISVTIQIATSASVANEISVIRGLSESVTGKPVKVLGFTNLRATVNPESIAQIAQMSDVIWIEPWLEPRLTDERQGQIVANNYSGSQLASPDYLAWLQGYGLATTPDFIIDIADSGIDQGSLDPAVIHKAFLNPAGVPRVAYADYESASGQDGAVNDITGHGTLNASIAGGYDNDSEFPDTDSQGYRFGLGVAPFAQLGVTKVFDPAFTNPDITSMVDTMYGNGARISSNSWGTPGNTYTTMSQLYDVAVRDAQPEATGNQGLTVVFSSGNAGPNATIDSPGTAKNVITVGATQGDNPVGTDGCQIGPDQASDPNSIATFSSGGPVADGRTKPDIVAPGTHIEGALSQNWSSAASDICGPQDSPPGQTLYTWSSGTSQSVPAVSGAAALSRQYFEQTIGAAPSPAMVKAFLLNSASYLTGAGAGDNLPGRNQGWGLLNMGVALDGVPRVALDQTHLFTSTGQSFTLQCQIADPNTPVRVTLAWTDAAGTPAGAPEVNDLDLQVTWSGETFLGNNFSGNLSVIGGVPDTKNNIESVAFPAGASGNITITVVAANLTGDGVPGNGSAIDQDFALVVYNARPTAESGVDSPPSVNLTFPVGGETLVNQHLEQIQWASSDDKSITSQRIDFSADGGMTYTNLATVDGATQSLLWQVPAIPTTTAKIRITALDGVNLPVSVASAANFTIQVGPPDTTPPTVSLGFPQGTSVIGGGNTFQIDWTESDPVGVVNRLLELSTDGGSTYQQIATIAGPPTLTQQQAYQWFVPADISTTQGVLRLTVTDSAGNSSSVTSPAQFQIWALPIVTQVTYTTLKKGKAELLIVGRNFRKNQTEVFVDDIQFGKLTFMAQATGEATFDKVLSQDKKIPKKVPAGTFSILTIKLPETGQASPPFQFKRKQSD